MNAAEALNLCRFVRAACPQQAIDEHTPDAWSVLLADVRYVDAVDATTALAKRSPFVSPAEIIAEVRRIRRKRLEEHPPVDPPSGIEPAAYVDWLRDVHQRIADGEHLPTLPALTGPAKAEHRRRLAELMSSGGAS